jgi:hypothetical protein
MVGAGIDVQLGRNAGSGQASCEFEVFFEQQIESSDGDEGRRQSVEVLRARRGCVAGYIAASRRASE